MSASPPTIRVARRDELERIAALERDAFDPPWSAGDLAFLLESQRALLLLAEQNGAIRAYALFRRTAGEAELLRIAVERLVRGRGWATRLLADGLRRLAAAGDAACFLEVRVGNVPARRLYARAGFRTVGRRRAYYADGEDAMLYRRDL